MAKLETSQQNNLVSMTSSASTENQSLPAPRGHENVLKFEKNVISRIFPETASKNHKNQAILKFISVSIDYISRLYFNQNIKLTGTLQNVPEGISIFVFSRTEGKQENLHDAYSMIIRVDPNKANNPDIEKFLMSLLQSSNFGNLHHLMLISIPVTKGLSSLIAALDLNTMYLDTFANRNSYMGTISDMNLQGLDNLNLLLITHRNQDAFVICPPKLKRALVYCPESDENTYPNGLFELSFHGCSSLDLITVVANPKFKHKFRIRFDSTKSRVDCLRWEVPYSADEYCTLICDSFQDGFGQIILECAKTRILKELGRFGTFSKSLENFGDALFFNLTGHVIVEGSPCICGECTASSN